MSTELDGRLAPLGRSTTSHSHSHSYSTSSKRRSISSARGKLVELRPKVLVAPESPMDSKRKQHAQAQKQNRDRMKAALDRIAAMLEGAGPGNGNGSVGTGGTKAELVEAAVDYIQRLQGQIEQLRGAGHATG
ncbi:uncharacterized protein BDV17DRAFT_289888 [Aspergillus undulatus]|uniref:uncharacterized protein n=1 Tax=Aspergillus undulatus TaxID=1810928 RepID=UPI003CCDEB76